MDDWIDAFFAHPANNFLCVVEKGLNSGKLTHRFGQDPATEETGIARVAGHQCSVDIALAQQFGEVWFFMAERRRRIQPFDLHGEFATNINLAPGYVPIHVRRLEAVLVEQKTPSPHHRRGAIAEAADFLPLQLTRMVEFAFANIDVPLARAALEKNWQGEESKTFLACS